MKVHGAGADNDEQAPDQVHIARHLPGVLPEQDHENRWDNEENRVAYCVPELGNQWEDLIVFFAPIYMGTHG